MHQSKLNETLKKVKETSVGLEDLSDLDREDIDIYMRQQLEDEGNTDDDHLPTISNHLKTPDDELLFLVENCWNNYATTLQKFGKKVFKDYISENNFFQRVWQVSCRTA